MQKERIPMHKKSGFLCRERGARGKGTAEVGARQKRVGIRTSRARETLPSISWHAKGRPSRGIYPPGVSWVSPDEALGEGDPHARKGRARRGFRRAGSVLKNY